MEARDGELIPPAQQARDRQTVEAGFWHKARRTLGRIPFSEDAVAVFYCARDPATPMTVKATLYGALAYFILPIDVIPDMIAALGYADDAAVLIAAIKMVGGAITETHRRAARLWLETESPKGDAGDAARPLN